MDFSDLVGFDVDSIVPFVKKTEIPAPEELSYWESRKGRTFFIDYCIDENHDLVELCKIIIQMNIAEKAVPEGELKPIYLWIMSPGGDSTQSYFLCDLIKSSRIPVVTVCMGMAMSAAFDILISGKRRYMFKHGRAMTHQGYLGIEGSVDVVDAANKANKKQLEEWRDFILENTKIDAKTYNKYKNKDWYFNAEDALRYGVVDAIVDNFEDIV